MNVTGGHNSTNASNQSADKDKDTPTSGRDLNAGAGPPVMPRRAQELQN